MLAFKTIASGVLLIVLAIAGFIYVVARPKPLIQSLLPEQVAPKEEPVPSPDVPDEPESRPTPTSPELGAQSDVPVIRRFVVNLLSPEMAQTFVAPARVALKAQASPNREVEKIEFFTAPLGSSVCKSLDAPAEFERAKIGEALSQPYEFTWADVADGVYNIVAVATFINGEQQISDPRVIVVNRKAEYTGPGWTGWEPPYSASERPTQDTTLMSSPTPTPSLRDCPSITVKRLDTSSGWRDPITFKAELAGGIIPDDITYDWTVSGGEIVGGNGTSTITVRIDRVLHNSLVAGVEVGGLNTLCSNAAFSSVKFDRPSWIEEGKRSRLLGFKSQVKRLAEGKQADNQVFIFTQGESETCVDPDILSDAKFIKRYLVEVAGLRDDQVLIRNGGTAEEKDPALSNSDLYLWVKSDLAADEVARLDQSLKKSERRSVLPCRRSVFRPVKHVSPPRVNRTCPTVEDTISYETKLSVSHEQVNTCPYNSKDWRNSATQVQLQPSVTKGTYGNVPTFRYWTNGGNIKGESVAIWDLTSVRLRPGIYRALALSDDSCDCPSSNVATVEVKNLCTPCLSLRSQCDYDDPAKSMEIVADVPEFAAGQTVTYQWHSNKGTIVSGQGNERITVDTSMLAVGEKIEVTVRVGGLLRYCVNQLSIEVIVGECRPQVLPPHPDEPSQPRRRARRRPPEVQEPPTPEVQLPPTGSTVPPPENVNPHLKEKEWMKVSWAPRVKTDESFPITVSYNRTTEAFEVSSTPGEISEELKFGARFKSLKERYGPDYETFATARLVVAGIECNSCSQDQFQSLDAERVEWSWPVSPGAKGTHVFNIEIWTKGEPRNKQSGHQSIGMEKVWWRNNLKVEVTETLLTKNTVFAGGGLCAVLGFGLCVRGLKIYRIGDTYNVGQAVAVGRNVTMNNTTVNQQPLDKNVQSGEDKDA